jgi:hypothetical protein
MPTWRIRMASCAAMLAEWTFVPRDGEAEAVADAVGGLCVLLRKGGQIWGDAVIGTGARRVVCRVPSADALDDRNATAWVRKDLAEIAARCAEPPRWRALDGGDEIEPRLDGERSLVLFTHMFDRTSPGVPGQRRRADRALRARARSRIRARSSRARAGRSRRSWSAPPRRRPTTS